MTILRPGHEAAPHGQHLLLAATQRPGQLARPLLESREELEDLIPSSPSALSTSGLGYAPISRFSRMDMSVKSLRLSGMCESPRSTMSLESSVSIALASKVS